MTTTASTIRLDSDLRKELNKKLDEVGLTLNGYFTLAAKQFLIQGKVPFEIKSEPDIENITLNEKTRKAIIRAYAEEEGVIPNTAREFDNAQDIMEDLFGDK
ncbi:type II toxin-antitoxin system RelB/DinJ family antitoxin [Lactobacillus sp. PSON]|uniref:type II toxin-antitoxin system RelB/DinJ family antitoxin n=1 Tax=Lactobacillus sp. PSON TaxID=3455454 RepID=UPI004041E4C8